MNKNVIMQFLEQKLEYSKDDVELMEAIEDARMEMYVARQMFEDVSDHKLIEVAIHTEDVAKARYDYLISIAKQRELRRKIE